jgi:hypothetical protein
VLLAGKGYGGGWLSAVNEQHGAGNGGGGQSEEADRVGEGADG